MQLSEYSDASAMAYQALFRDGEALARHALSPALAALRRVRQVIDKALAPIAKHCLRPPRCRVNAAHACTHSLLFFTKPLQTSGKTLMRVEWAQTFAYDVGDRTRIAQMGGCSSRCSRGKSERIMAGKRKRSEGPVSRELVPKIALCLSFP